MTGIVRPEAEQVLRFWLEETAAAQRFAKDAALDAEIATRFGALSGRVLASHAAGWRDDPHTLLAAIILVDQFPRNMFRGSARAFEGDALARELTGRALARGWDQELGAVERQFLYIPLMHSENADDQVRSVALYEALGIEDAARFARLHRDQILRFGRFPGRNAALGRVDTPEETAFLATPGSRF
mgnify:CR=1 FL=1|jgi:uncharacterized protein (DUF924 family)